MKTDTTEKGLETLIMSHMTGTSRLFSGTSGKGFARTYDFLATILPYGVQEWEKLSIFLNFLIPKLPAPKEEDLSKGILEAIDMDSYRAEKKATLAIALPDADAEIQPVPTSGGGRKPEPEMDRLSNIIKAFGGLFNDPKAVEARIMGVANRPPRVTREAVGRHNRLHRLNPPPRS